jgi:hypothetical protein
VFRRPPLTVPLVTALRTAETLSVFHRHRAENSVGATRDYHLDMARRCGEDAARSRRAILESGATVENQADAVRRRDLEVAQRIIDRHPIMHGVGMPADDVPAVRSAMARDIADALATARGGMAS